MKKFLSLICFLAVAWLCNAAYAGTVEDVLTKSTFPANSSTYVAFSGIKGTSGAVYAGETATTYEAIQLRTTGSTSGIISTESGGKVRKVVVEWNTNSNSSRKLQIFGKNTPYTATSELYNSFTQGDNIGIIGTTQTEYEISGDYAYVGLKSSSGAIYLDKITIVWENATALSAPKFSVEGGTYDEAQSVTFTGIDEGATVRYTTDAEVDLKGETGFDVWDGLRLQSPGHRLCVP